MLWNDCSIKSHFQFLNLHYTRICEDLVKGEKSKEEFDNLIHLINNQFVTFIKQELYGFNEEKSEAETNRQKEIRNEEIARLAN